MYDIKNRPLWRSYFRIRQLIMQRTTGVWNENISILLFSKEISMEPKSAKPLTNIYALIYTKSSQLVPF